MPRIVPSQVVGYINEKIPEATWLHLGPVQLGVLHGLLNLIDAIPEELFQVDTSDYSMFVHASSTIRSQLRIWESNAELVVRGFAPNILGNPHPIGVIKTVMGKCPDESPAQATTNLVFISDTALRDSLRIDIAAIYRALVNSEWKAATVLSGSVVEALLLWALQTKQQTEIEAAVNRLDAAEKLGRRPSGALDAGGWSLQAFIEVARELNLISEPTAIQARLAKDFRNLIHPARAQRLAQKCDRATVIRLWRP